MSLINLVANTPLKHVEHLLSDGAGWLGDRRGDKPPGSGWWRGDRLGVCSMWRGDLGVSDKPSPSPSPSQTLPYTWILTRATDKIDNISSTRMPLPESNKTYNLSKRFKEPAFYTRLSRRPHDTFLDFSQQPRPKCRCWNRSRTTEYPSLQWVSPDIKKNIILITCLS